MREIMKLGAFSISLSVKDIKASKQFYEKLGFSEFDGNIEENWLIMKNGDATIGLFQGMFPKNTLTFNPGWSQDAKELKDYDDVRDIQKKLEDDGIELSEKVSTEQGPGYLSLTDPDGNPILIDQHR